MFNTGGVAVATGGRPKKTDGKVSTKHVRINDDLAEMLSWVLRAMGRESTSAQVLDPFLRGPITGLYNRYEDTISALKAAERKAKKGRDGQRPAP